MVPGLRLRGTAALSTVMGQRSLSVRMLCWGTFAGARRRLRLALDVGIGYLCEGVVPSYFCGCSGTSAIGSELDRSSPENPRNGRPCKDQRTKRF